MGHFFHIFERRSCQDQNNQGCNSRFSHEYQDSQSSCNQGRCDVSRPSGCGQAGSLELSNPYQRVESQRQLMRGAPEGSYGEDNVLGAIAAAKANGKPILAMNVGREGLSDESKAHLTTLQKDYNVVLIDRAHAD